MDGSKRTAFLASRGCINVCRVLLILCVCTASSAAFAQRCADILVNGTQSKTDLSTRSSYQRYLWTQLSRMTFKDAKKKRAVGGDIPIGELVLGAKFSEEDLANFKERFQKTVLNQETSTSSVDLVLSTGDPLIVEAWQTCMQKQKSGPSARYVIDSDSSPRITLVLEYFPAVPDVVDMTLDEDVVFPKGVTVEAGASCLKKGATIKAFDPCIATLTVTTGNLEFPINLNTNRGGFVGPFVAKRLSAREEVAAFEFPRDANIGFSGARTQKTQSYTARVPADKANQGWYFDASSADFRVSTTWSKNGGACRNATQTATASTFKYSYRVHAPDRSRGGRDAAVTCSATPSINLKRTVWESSVVP